MNLKDLSLFIYEAIEKPQRRPDLLATFAEIIEADAAAVAVEDRQLRWATFRVTHGMDRETIDSYCHYYACLDPYALRRLQNPGDSYKSDELISEAEFKETELYHGWLKAWPDQTDPHPPPGPSASDVAWARSGSGF